jgi:hypothetical protein
VTLARSMRFVLCIGRRQMIAAHRVSAASRGLEIDMTGEKFRDLGLSTARAGSVPAPC